MGKQWAGLLAGLVALGCAAAGDGEEQTGEIAQELAPAGSDARVVGSTMPSEMYPGERRLVTVTTQNTGTASPANDWTAPAYALRTATAALFGWTSTSVPATVAVGAQQTFSFVVTAPPASQTFSARMTAGGSNYFGDTVSVPVTVNPSATPQWGCSLVSTTLPAQLAPGESRFVTVTVRNTGSEIWPAANVKLVSRDTPVNLWGNTTADITAAVAPGATATFGINLKAPATAGTYAFQRDPKHFASIGDFRSWGFCVTQNVVVGGVSALDSAIVGHSIPTTFAPGESKVVSVTMRNTGSETWATDGSYALYSRSNPVNLWGFTLRPVTTATPTSATSTFWVTVKAPTTPGSYSQAWQMRKGSVFFGPTLSVPITVQSAAPVPALDSALVSHDFPEFMGAGETKTVNVVLRNTGSQPWPKDNTLFLFSKTNPPALWGGSSARALPAATAPGASATFSFNITAPAPGTYPIVWQLRNSAGFFGAIAQASIRTFDPAILLLDAAVVSHDIPAAMTAGQTYPVTVVMRNTGRTRWTSNTFLQQRTLPVEGPPFEARPPTGDGIAPDATKAFSLTVKAPADPGKYFAAFRMLGPSAFGSSPFGETARQEVTVSSGPSGALPCAVPPEFPVGTYYLQTASTWNFLHPSAECVALAKRLRLTLAPDPGVTGGYLAAMEVPVGWWSINQQPSSRVVPVVVTSDDGAIMHLKGGNFDFPSDTFPDVVIDDVEFDVSRTGVITNLKFRHDWHDDFVGGFSDFTATLTANGWLTCASDPPGSPVPAVVPLPVMPPLTFCGAESVPPGCYATSFCGCPNQDHVTSCTAQGALCCL